MNNKSNDDFYVKWEKNDFKYSTERINELKYIIDDLSQYTTCGLNVSP